MNAKLQVYFLRLKGTLRSLALPLAIAVGIIFYKPLSCLSGLIPYFLVGMLFFSFLKVRPSELRINKVHLILAGVQLLLAIVPYLFLAPWVPSSISQSVMLCFLCPVASASPVVIGMLGGNVSLAAGYVLYNTVAVGFIAPVFFSFIAPVGESFWLSVWHILGGVVPLILIPLIATFLIRRFSPQVHVKLLRYTQVAFWLWVVSLALIIAKVVHYMALEPQSEIPTMIWLALIGLLTCLLQFALGKWLSRKLLHESITLGQSLGQKNTSLAIWMSQAYLNPLVGVSIAAYSIWQNIINSTQLAIYSRKVRQEADIKPHKRGSNKKQP